MNLAIEFFLYIFELLFDSTHILIDITLEFFEAVNGFLSTCDKIDRRDLADLVDFLRIALFMVIDNINKTTFHLFLLRFIIRGYKTWIKFFLIFEL